MIKTKFCKRKRCTDYQKDSGMLRPPLTLPLLSGDKGAVPDQVLGRQHQKGDRETTVCTEVGRGAPTGR